MRGRVNIAINDISAEHVSRVGVRIAEEVSKGDRWKREVVIEVVLIELHDSSDGGDMNSMDGDQRRLS